MAFKKNGKGQSLGIVKIAVQEEEVPKEASLEDKAKESEEKTQDNKPN